MPSLRNLFRKPASKPDFHPDRPPPDPYPYAPTDSYPPPPGPPPEKDPPTDHQPLPSTRRDPPPPPASSSADPTFFQTPAAPPSSYTPQPPSPPPPPPAILSLVSPTNNASGTSASAGWAFEKRHPLSPPLRSGPSPTITLARPPRHFTGRILSGTTIAVHGPCPDTTLVSAAPIFSARRPSRRVRFDVAVESCTRDAVVVVGVVALPYPEFRMPGWNRGSVAVHSDDGRRYANDAFGGREFTAPFGYGGATTVGVEMEWGVGAPVVRFWRDGRCEGEWAVDEVWDHTERDKTIGLMGDHDLFAAVGVFVREKRGEVRVRVLSGDQPK